MDDHTKGQLAYSFEGDGSARVIGQIGNDATSVCSVAVLTINHRSVEEARANARRIVACWNACVDVPTDLLENHPSPFSRLREERDELAMQLQRVYDALGGECFDWEPVRAALAKAGGVSHG